MKSLLATAFLLPLLLCACSLSTPEAEEKDKKTKVEPPKLVGRIASIPASRKFVLIQSYGKWTIPAGSILTSEGPDGRAANLLATGETLGQYAAADIQSGTLEVGDGVHFRPPAPQPTPETPAQDAETETLTENIKKD